MQPTITQITVVTLSVKTRSKGFCVVRDFCVHCVNRNTNEMIGGQFLISLAFLSEIPSQGVKTCNIKLLQVSYQLVLAIN